MESATPQLAVEPVAEKNRVEDLPGREYQELWFSLARTPWTSLVLIPADAGGSAATIATSLAEVGKRLRTAPVTAFVADLLDFGAAGQLAAKVAAAGQAGSPRSATSGRSIFAIPPVVTQPLGVAVAQVADAVILCVEKDRSRLDAIRRTIELVGRDRITGCFYLT